MADDSETKRSTGGRCGGEKTDSNTTRRARAHWKIDMHCQSCVRATRSILGEGAEVDLQSKTASVDVGSRTYANKLTEDLLDVGLDAKLEKFEERNQSTSEKPRHLCCKSCQDCNCCPETCQCTETICQCQASSILNALEFDRIPFTAVWNIEMHCESCVRTAKGVLGEVAIVNLHLQRAERPVESEEEAKELTEDLQDVGLEASLERVVQGHAQPLSPSNFTPASARKQRLTSQSDPPVEDPLAPVTNDLAGSNQPNEIVLDIVVGGMTCSMCSKAISEAIKRLGEIKSVKVNVATNIATVHYYPPAMSEEAICRAIEEAGYEIHEVLKPQSGSEKLESLQQSQRDEVARNKFMFLWSLIGSGPILIFTMVLPLLLRPEALVMRWLHSNVNIHGFSIMKESIILAALASLVQFGPGSTFYKSSYHNICVGQLGMDVLVALGTTASYAYAWDQTLEGEEAHAFETSAVLICFVLLGKWMNKLAVRRTSEALQQLMQLQTKTAILATPQEDGTFEEKNVNIEEIHPGDMVKVLRGASIPADGVVSQGELTVDESMITGESVPILKTPGSLVLGGTVCVEGPGSFIEVTGVGANTALSQIVQLVQDAQTRQVPIQNLADTISTVFVPTVCTISVLTFLVWYALCNTKVVPPSWYEKEGDATFSIMFAIACLVISCPCALGLATPTAVMVGTGVGARHGVLMKGGETLETTSKVNSVVFDKTGTLTKGRPCITDYHRLAHTTKNHLDNNYLMWLWASLERNSEHPLALAVVNYAEKEISKYLASKPLEHPLQFKALTGRGASGEIHGHTVSIGNRPFAAMNGFEISGEVEARMASYEIEGKTAILAAVDGEIVVVMGIADELKSDAYAALKFLKYTLKCDVWMVTGDNARTAEAISRKLGLSPDRVISEALPVAKVQQVKRLQKDGKTVAMIGDGINDSPALAEADVGMSLGTGAEIACEAADMVLVRGHVADVCTAIDLSRVIFGRIKLNFVFSLIYNCLGIPVAAGALYPFIHTRLPPTLAAVAMALSSLSVVGSSLVLQLYQPPNIETAGSRTMDILVRQISSQPSNTPPTTSREAGCHVDSNITRTRDVENHDNDLTEPLLGRDDRNEPGIADAV